MRSEKEIRERIEFLKTLKGKEKPSTYNQILIDVLFDALIDELKWVLGEKGSKKRMEPFIKW